MSERTQLTVHGGLALLAIDNPPVNALGAEVVAELSEQIRELEARDDIRTVVLHGTNGIFSGGADIRGFGKPPASGPTLRDVIGAIERSAKIFVAILEGNALGGGLELAMACDYRLARSGTRLGQPEIKIGLLPGAGGTQRLPRLIGLEAALQMIVGGDSIVAERALELGLVDKLLEGDAAEAAESFVKSKGGRKRRARGLPVRGDASAIDAARSRAEPVERGGLAAHHAIEAVAGCLKLPFDEALVRERALFEELRASEQSKARIHVFFGEREAAKVPGIPASSFRSQRAVVVGGGTMGTGITMTLANAGIDVTMVDLDASLLERSRETMRRNYEATMRKGRLDAAEMERRLERISQSTDLAAVANVDLVIEAVFEEMDIKKEVFRNLDRLAPANAMLATNTSTLDIDAIASATKRPEHVVGTHFFSPANVMRLLEIVRGKTTGAQVVADALSLSKQLGKVGVVAGNCDGFIGNRMLAPYRREADFLLEEGATPEQVDRVIRAFGFPMGPYAMVDLTGLDVSWRVRKRRNAEKPPIGRYSKLQDRMCELGRFGQKTGAGFYRYENGNRTPQPDPFVIELIRTVGRDAGIKPRRVEDDEIVKRCIYALINEAANILDEGIAIRASDIDVVWVHGYGFPNWRGGPLRYAEVVGLAKVYDDIRALEARHGVYWKPARLLEALAKNGGSFSSVVRAPA